MPSSSSSLLPISAAGRVFWNKWELCHLFYVTYFPALPELYLKCCFPPLSFRISKHHPPSHQGWHWSVAHPHTASLSPPTPVSAPGRDLHFHRSSSKDCGKGLRNEMQPNSHPCQRCCRRDTCIRRWGTGAQGLIPFKDSLHSVGDLSLSRWFFVGSLWLGPYFFFFSSKIYSLRYKYMLNSQIWLLRNNVYWEFSVFPFPLLYLLS